MISPRLVVLALSTATTFAVSASELDDARRDARAVTSSLEQRPCPALGDRTYIRGLTEAQQLSAAADRERAFVDRALQQLEQIARDPALSGKQRSELRALASWSIAASTANWSMLQVAQQALADPLIAEGRRHPAAVIESAHERVNVIARNGAMSADAAAIVGRQAAAVERCRKGFSAKIFELNELQFQAAIARARSTAELDRVQELYRARDAASGGYGAGTLDMVTARRAAIAEEERIAREAAAAANAAEAARRQAEAQRRQAELNARLETHLAVAQRFAAASANGDERAALAELSPSVVMSTPQGSYRGIDQVVAAVRQQAASGTSGSLGRPRIQGNRIVANGMASGLSITTVFGFDESNRIARIDISL